MQFATRYQQQKLDKLLPETTFTVPDPKPTENLAEQLIAWSQQNPSFANEFQRGQFDFLHNYVKNDLVNELAHVPIRAAIPITVEQLLQHKPAAREQVVDKLLTWLSDGLVPSIALADALADSLLKTKQGFTYLDQALASFSATGRAGQVLVILTLEQVLARVSEKNAKTFRPQHLSKLLTQLVELLEDSDRAVYDSQARANLETIANSGKKSVAVTRAKEIIKRKSPPGMLPPAVECVAYLVGALDAKTASSKIELD